MSAGRVAGSPRGLGLLGPQEGAPPASSSPGQNKLSFKTQKIPWVKPEFLLSLHYSFKHPGNATHRPPSLCRPRALQGRAAEARRLEKSGCAETEGCYHRNWTGPLKLCFLTHTHMHPAKGRGQQRFCFSQICPGGFGFAVIVFFSAVACSAACGFLFLDANVGACFFKIKRRERKWILKLGVFFHQSWLYFLQESVGD